jgi:hypothetical protein
MPGRNSLYNSQGGRGFNQNGRGGNGRRGNENTRNQTTPPNAKSSFNPKSSTNSNLSLGGHSDVVNSLLGRAGDTNSNSTSNRSNQTNSDIHTQSEQARIQAEAALKGVEENNNRQREERNAKAPESRARAQAEAQRKEAEDLLRQHSTDDLIHPGDDYFQLSSSIPHFSYAQSPSFGAHA